jgi:hypothetical protein
MPSVLFEPALPVQRAALPAGLLGFIARSGSKARASEFASPVLASLADFRPTQMAVGMRAVTAKREKVQRRADSGRKLRRFLEKRPVPAIVGPDDGFYILDHHHLSLALWQSNVDEAFVRVIGDYSHLSGRRFLEWMTESGCLHAFDAKGRRACPTRLPRSLGDLKCDRYRDLAWSVREAGGFLKTAAPFSEFRWANYFRDRIPMSTVRRDFDLAHDKAMWLARSDRALHLPGFIERS